MNKIKTIIKNYHPNKYLLFTYLLIPIIFFASNQYLGLDNDRWFILNTGKYILSHGFPYIDPFTIHIGLSVIAQQWLFSIILYLIYNIFGDIGLMLFTIIMVYIAAFIFYKICNLLNDNRRCLSTILTVCFTTLYIYNYATTRPHLSDFIIFLLEFYILEKYIKENKTKVLLFLPLLSIIQINTHASTYFMFYAFMLPYILNIKSKYFETQNYHVKPLIIIMIISLIVSIINPYSFEAHKYLFNSYGNESINITIGEMHSTLGNIKNIHTIIIIITFAIPNLLAVLSKKKIKLRYFLLYLGTMYLAISNYKGYQYYLMGAIFPLSDYVKEKFLITKAIITLKITKYLSFVIYLLILIFSVMIFKHNYQLEKYKSIHPIISLVEKLDNIVETKKLNKNELKIYTDYDIGGYVEWMGYKAYIDPRAEVFLKKNNKKEDIFEEYYNLITLNINEREKVADFLDKYKFDYIIVSKDDNIYLAYLDSLDNQDYTYIMEESNENETYYLYERNT